MTRAAALLALLLAPPAPAETRRPDGLLVLAGSAGGAWRAGLPALRARLKGWELESVEGEADAVAIQRALDRLERKRVGVVAAVPLEALSASPAMGRLSYLFGRADAYEEDLPDRSRGNSSRPAGRKPPKRLFGSRPVGLAPALGEGGALAGPLADRTRALSRRPEREAVLLAGFAPRSERALKPWLEEAEALAEKVRASAGLARAGVLYVRDGMPAEARERDRAQIRARLRAATAGGLRALVVPLGAEPPAFLDRALRRAADGPSYRWDGRGILGHPALPALIEAAARQAAAGARPLAPPRSPFHGGSP